MMSIFGTELLEKILDMSAIRHRVISNNIANVDTPGYKSKSFSFEDELKNALSPGGDLPLNVTNNAHIQSGGFVGSVRGTLELDPINALRNDGNSVDIDKEMVENAKNNLLFSAMSRIISGKFAALEGAINEGRR